MSAVFFPAIFIYLLVLPLCPLLAEHSVDY